MNRFQKTCPVAIVTGASRGFGRAVTAALLDRGWAVVGDARRASELKTTARELNSTQLIALPGDVTDPSHRDALVGAATNAGPLRLLVNNASRLGPSPQPALSDYPARELSAVYQTNLFAPLALIQAGLPALTDNAGVIVNLTYYGIVFVLSLYLQKVLGYTPTRAGLAYLPLTATFFGINIVSGWWVGRVGSRKPMVVGALIDAVGFGLLLPLGAASSYWIMLPAFALMPCGMGLGVPAMTTAVLASVDRRQSGVASGVLNAARQGGGAIGVALFGAIATTGRARIVTGLHISATIAIGLLIAATFIAGLRRRQSAHAASLPSQDNATVNRQSRARG